MADVARSFHLSHPALLTYTPSLPRSYPPLKQDPLYNKGSGFEHGERDRLNIRGLVPPRHLDFKTQIDRVRELIYSRF